jgi:prepilin signal peptidase PulO-like enzyme (type II secretory pathway)
MNLTLLIIYCGVFAYIGLLCSKYWSDIFKQSPTAAFNGISFLKKLIPFHQIFFLDLRTKDYRKEIFLELFSMLLTAFFSFAVLIILQNLAMQVWGIIALFVFFNAVYFALLYLAVYDIRTYTIPADFVRNVLIMVVIIQGCIALIQLILHTQGNDFIESNIVIGSFSNLLGGIAGFGIITLIITITDNKGMGEGDIDTSTIIGLVLGFTQFWISFLVTILVGFVLSIFVIVFTKKVKGFVIPFVPLQLIGFVVSLRFGSEIARILFGI